MHRPCTVANVAACRHLKKKAEEGTPMLPDAKLSVLQGVVRGMAYLVNNHYVHRDLAARNILLDSKMDAKVADFGLSRAFVESKDAAEPGMAEDKDYYRSSEGVCAVRWTPPEAMHSMKFSEATDVWSLGIVAWEVYTNADKPYQGMKNLECVEKVQAGYRYSLRLAPLPTPLRARALSLCLSLCLSLPLLFASSLSRTLYLSLFGFLSPTVTLSLFPCYFFRVSLSLPPPPFFPLPRSPPVLLVPSVPPFCSSAPHCSRPLSPPLAHVHC